MVASKSLPAKAEQRLIKNTLNKALKELWWGAKGVMLDMREVKLQPVVSVIADTVESIAAMAAQETSVPGSDAAELQKMLV